MIAKRPNWLKSLNAQEKTWRRRAGRPPGYSDGRLAPTHCDPIHNPCHKCVIFYLSLATERGPVVLRQKYSEEYFRTVFETAPSGVLAVDASGRIALLNAQAERMFGYNREELIGKPVEVLVPQRFRGRHADLRKRDAANPRIRPMGTDRSFLGVRKDGSEFPVEVGLNPAVMSTGQSCCSDRRRYHRAQRPTSRAWHATTVAALFLVFGLVIVVF